MWTLLLILFASLLYASPALRQSVARALHPNKEPALWPFERRDLPKRRDNATRQKDIKCQDESCETIPVCS